MTPTPEQEAAMLRLRTMKYFGSDQNAADVETLLECVESLRARVQDYEKVCEAARTLVARMKVVYDDPHYITVWAQYQNHGGDYTNGPKWEKEFDALNKILQAAGRTERVK